MSSPAISRDLLDHLQRVFPDKLPEAPTTLEHMGTLIGQQKVIRHLQALFNAQQKAEGLAAVLAN